MRVHTTLYVDVQLNRQDYKARLDLTMTCLSPGLPFKSCPACCRVQANFNKNYKGSDGQKTRGDTD